MYKTFADYAGEEDYSDILTAPRVVISKLVQTLHVLRYFTAYTLVHFFPNGHLSRVGGDYSAT